MKYTFLHITILFFAFFCSFSIFITARSIIFPLKYKETIIMFCDKNNLDYKFVSSLIYCESKFKSDALSNKGAVGLMQIMPLTGLSFYDGDKNSFAVNDLYDPVTNISVGTNYLKYLFDKYKNKITVLACYNAGEKIVNIWLGDKEVLSVDMILYKETKKYVQKVINVQKAYKSRF